PIAVGPLYRGGNGAQNPRRGSRRNTHRVRLARAHARVTERQSRAIAWGLGLTTFRAYSAFRAGGNWDSGGGSYDGWVGAERAGRESAAALLVAILAAVERGELTAPQPLISHLTGALAALQALESQSAS